MSRPSFCIEELRIESFRGIDELRLTLRGDEEDLGGLAVLAGDNGCGKTAALEAILLVLGRPDLLPADAAPLNEQVRFGAGDFLIEATVRKSDGTREALRVDVETLDPVMGGLKSLDLFDGDPSKKASRRASWAAITALDASVEYFSARREPKALDETPDPRRELPTARQWREPLRVVDLKQRLRNTYYHSLRAGKGREMPEGSPFVRLQRFVQRFLGEDHFLDVLPVSHDPGADDEVILRRGELPDDITSLSMARRAAVEREGFPIIVPIDQLSSGQIALFAFAGPLIFRDVPADVVLIDEPERHMHVQWQRQLIGALRELAPGSQFIVATHSREVLDSALSYERFILVREEDPRARLSLGATGEAAA